MAQRVLKIVVPYGIPVIAFLALIYVPPMFDTPGDAVLRGTRECGWAIRTNSNVEAKCQAFLKLERHGPGDYKGTAGDIWMQVAEYRLLQGDVGAPKEACRQAMASYERMDEIVALRSNRTTPSESARRCSQSNR